MILYHENNNRIFPELNTDSNWLSDMRGIVLSCHENTCCHDDAIRWKHFPRYWPFVGGIHWSPVNSPHKGQRRGTLMFCLICARIKGWVNNRKAGDLRRHRAHYDVIVTHYWLFVNGIHDWQIPSQIPSFIIRFVLYFDASNRYLEHDQVTISPYDMWNVFLDETAQWNVLMGI